MHVHLGARAHAVEEVAIPSRKQSEVSGQGLPLRAIGEGGGREGGLGEAGRPRWVPGSDCTGHDCQGRRVVTDLPGPRPQQTLQMERTSRVCLLTPSDTYSLWSFSLHRASNRSPGQLPFLRAPLTPSLLLCVRRGCVLIGRAPACSARVGQL